MVLHPALPIPRCARLRTAVLGTVAILLVLVSVAEAEAAIARCQPDSSHKQLTVSYNLSKKGFLYERIFSLFNTDEKLCLAKLAINEEGKKGSWQKQFDRVSKGPRVDVSKQVDLALVLPRSSRDRFEGFDVVRWPNSMRNASEGSRALWKLYHQDKVLSVDKQVKLLAVFTTPPKLLHTVNPIKSLPMIEGRRIAVRSRSLAGQVRRLGARPVIIRSSSELLAAFSNGSVVGTVMSWYTLNRSKIQTLTKYHVRLSFGSTPVVLAINKETFDGLNLKQKEALEEAGQTLIARWGTEYDKRYDSRRYEERGDEFIVPERDEVRRFVERYAGTLEKSGQVTTGILDNLKKFEKALESVRKKNKRTPSKPPGGKKK